MVSQKVEPVNSRAVYEQATNSSNNESQNANNILSRDVFLFSFENNVTHCIHPPHKAIIIIRNIDKIQITSKKYTIHLIHASPRCSKGVQTFFLWSNCIFRPLLRHYFFCS